MTTTENATTGAPRCTCLTLDCDDACREQDTCEHGLSAWLCAGPEHYPIDLP